MMCFVAERLGVPLGEVREMDADDFATQWAWFAQGGGEHWLKVVETANVEMGEDEMKATLAALAGGGGKRAAQKKTTTTKRRRRR